MSLPSFCARRAGRSLPAAALVPSPLRARDVARDAAAAALQAANLRFASAGTDCLAPHAPSPLPHYRSLAVEERFYALWPLLAASLA